MRNLLHQIAHFRSCCNLSLSFFVRLIFRGQTLVSLSSDTASRITKPYITLCQKFFKFPTEIAFWWNGPLKLIIKRDATAKFIIHGCNSYLQEAEQQEKMTGEHCMPSERLKVHGRSALEGGASAGVQQGSLNWQALAVMPQSHSSPSCNAMTTNWNLFLVLAPVI